MASRNPTQTPSPANSERPEDTVARAKESSARAAEETRKAASAIGEEIQHTAEDAAHRVEREAEKEKNSFARTLDSVAAELRRSAENLRQSDPMAGQLFDNGASACQSLSNSLDSRDIRTLTGNANEYAKDHPGSFLASAIAAGFALSRFGKVATSRTSDHLEAADRKDTSVQNGQYSHNTTGGIHEQDVGRY